MMDDNDCNGFADAQDPACQDEDGVADGFLNAEVIDASTCTCGDGLDNDEDGWTDVDDRVVEVQPMQRK